MKKTKENITRYRALPNKGLSEKVVEKRIQDGLVNKTKIVVGKSYLDIFLTDVLSFFNILLITIGIFLIMAKKYDGLFFLFVLIPNILITLFEDIKARRLMSKLRVLTVAKTIVVRESSEREIPVDQIVLDDVVKLKAGDQISVDGILIDGDLLVNEAMLTGESQSISKVVGDRVFSGSYVVSGTAKIHATEIGNDTYLEKLQQSAKKFKRSRSEILTSLTRLVKTVGTISVVMGIVMIAAYILKGEIRSFDDFLDHVSPISGSMVAMIPSGLYLLTSMTLALATITLNKKNARVQDFYSVEMLARTDVLCVDKTGTITDGTMMVKSVVPFGKYSRQTVTTIVSDIIHGTRDNNFTAKALKTVFNYKLSRKLSRSLPFNSDNKYSACTFKDGDTFAFGATESFDLGHRIGTKSQVSEYTRQGYRVVLVVKCKKGILNNKIKGEVEPVGMIVLQDHIKDDAVRTFEWFRKNNVDIKVISGDDANTVSAVAEQAGIVNAKKAISLMGLSDKQVHAAANKYTVFGRVNPHQKAILVKALKEAGHTVAMTGDGVNDILALKTADCSIAMASGAEAAKNVSHIVLLNSNFECLPDVVGQGRRVINNCQRSACLFVTKTIFAILATIGFFVLYYFEGIEYPFITNHMYIWEIFSIGVAAFFLSLEPNNERIKGSFLASVFTKSLPAAICLVLSIGLIFAGYFLNHPFGGAETILATNIDSLEAATAMSILVFTGVGLAVLFKVCHPFNTYRRTVFGAVGFISAICLLIAAYLTFTVDVDSSLFKINFTAMNAQNWLQILIVLSACILVFYFITFIIEKSRNKKYVKNK